ncbi:Pyranose dehydrogenase [Cytospora mali]|uniref:Pyranose dehydrogenase n=1 Tax=Cytospora mali TaxID=578113 RepID=A0A194VVK2_CYTMA|nr:Pyranose dehydrogenase [Valsa mali]
MPPTVCHVDHMVDFQIRVVPTSALQHRGRAPGSDSFGPAVDARPKGRDIRESTTGVDDVFDYGLPSASILVIEAGPYVTDDLDINVPGLRGKTLGTIYDWNFTTLPVEALKNRTIAVNRGRVLGGCSAHNGLIWNRAAVAEYDSWEELGNPGWNWETIYAAMQKSENYTGKNKLISPLLNLWEPSVGNVSSLVGNNNSNQGLPMGISLGGPNSIDPTHYNASYSTNGYLPQAGPNLTILPNTTVAKVNLQKTASRSNESLYTATGVTLLDGTTLTANKEVILSAGAVQSPQLLELSGVGQPDILRAAGITPLIDLAGVGENYQDHTGFSISYQLKDDTDYLTSDLMTTNATFAAEELAKWFAGETSLYDSGGGVGFAFADWTTLLGADKAAQLKALAKPSANAPSGSPQPPPPPPPPPPDAVTRMKLALLDDPSVPQAELVIGTGYSGSKGYPARGTPLYGKRFITLEAAVEHPLSRGSTHVNAADPLLGKPAIDARFFSHAYDRAGTVALARALRALAAAEPLRSVLAAEYEPGLAVVPGDATDEEWWEGYLAGVASSTWHLAGTCAMLPRGEGGVVGADLRVYGTGNLRVVDASVAPLLVAAHPQTVVYGIAEVAAGMVVAGL